MHTTIHIHIQNMHQVFGSRLVASRYARRKKHGRLGIATACRCGSHFFENHDFESLRQDRLCIQWNDKWRSWDGIIRAVVSPGLVSASCQTWIAVS